MKFGELESLGTINPRPRAPWREVRLDSQYWAIRLDLVAVSMDHDRAHQRIDRRKVDETERDKSEHVAA